MLPYIELGCALLAGGLWYLQGGAVWYEGGWPGPWPLLLLGLMWSLAGLRTRFTLRLTRFDLLLGLFVLSALVATQTAYAPGPARAKFWLVVGAWGIYYALVHQPDLEHLYGALAFWGLFGVALTAYFFLTNDWSAHPVKVPLLIDLGEAISARLPALSTHQLSPNVTGGMLATVLPFYVPLILLPRRGEDLGLPARLRRLLPALWTAALGVTLLGLLVSTSRGAWLGALAGFLLWGLWRALGRRFEGRRRLAWMGGLLAAGAVLLAVALYAILAYDLPGAGALTNRLTLLRDSLLLARDYVFTGAGLGTFMMNFSIYTLLIHVGHTVHSHNLLINLLVEQGVVGLLLYLALVVVCVVEAVRRRRHAPRSAGLLIEAGLVSLAIVLAHGQVDDALYGSRGLLLLFVPFAVVRGAGAPVGEEERPRARGAWRPVALGLVLLLVLGLAFRRPLQAQWYASLGAMLQARTELALYEHGRTPGFIMDAVRQEEELAVPIALFERAVALDPGNATARQRLAGIHLSRREYAAAYEDIAAAWEAGHRDSVTRLLLGDAHVAQGRVEEGVAVIHGLYWAQPRMEGQAWSRYWVQEDYARAAHAWRAVALLDPENGAGALEKARQAESRATPEP
ncbi:MAG: O-antigen ligase family protein [Anaerolineales bacterium]